MFYRNAFRLIHFSEPGTNFPVVEQTQIKEGLYKFLGVSKLFYDYNSLAYQYIYMFCLDLINGSSNSIIIGKLFSFLILLFFITLQIYPFHKSFNGDNRYFDNCWVVLLIWSLDTIRFSVVLVYQAYLSSPLKIRSSDPITISCLIFDFIVTFSFFIKNCNHRRVNPLLKKRHECSHECDCNCSICLSSLREQTIVMLDCKHEYHEECIMEWSKRSEKCPLCNTSSVIIQIE